MAARAEGSASAVDASTERATEAGAAVTGSGSGPAARAAAVPDAVARLPFHQRVFRTRAEDRLPVALEHQRIYILPTRRGWAFLGSLALMLVASVNYSLSLGYALCFLLTGLFSATLLHTYRNLAGLALRHVEAGSAFAGERLPFALAIANPSRLDRHGLRVRTRGEKGTPPVEGRTDVAAGARAELALDVRAAVRGRLALGRLTLDSDWPLGLWRAWSYVHAPVHGVVFPAPEPEPPPLPVEPDAAAGALARQGGRGDVAGLRPYVPGDVPSTIAWKSLARGQGLHVRTFDDESGRSRTRLTLAATGLPGLEARLSRLAAWVLAAEAGGGDYALELPGVALAAGRGPAQRREALTALALHGEVPLEDVPRGDARPLGSARP